jgi:hypothetical protein
MSLSPPAVPERRNDLSGVFGDPRIAVPPVPEGAAK